MKTPRAIWQQDAKHALFVIVITLFIFGVPALILFFGFGQPIGKAAYIAFALGTVVAVFPFVFTWFKNRRQAGPVVLDLLPVPGRRTSLLLGATFILSGFLGVYRSASLSARDSWLVSSLIGLSLGIYQILFAGSRLEVRENGIMIYTEFAPWDQIEAFEWLEGDETFSTLKLQYRSRFPAFLRKVDLPVPIEKKQQLELSLEQHRRGQALGEKRL